MKIPPVSTPTSSKNLRLTGGHLIQLLVHLPPYLSPCLSLSLGPWWIKVTFTVTLHQALSRFKSLPY